MTLERVEENQQNDLSKKGILWYSTLIVENEIFVVAEIFLGVY